MKGSSVKRDLLQCQQRPKMPLKQRGMYIETQTGMTPVSTRDRGEKGGGKSSKRPLRSLRRGLNKRERDRGCMTPVSKSGRGGITPVVFESGGTMAPVLEKVEGLREGGVRDGEFGGGASRVAPGGTCGESGEASGDFGGGEEEFGEAMETYSCTRRAREDELR